MSYCVPTAVVVTTAVAVGGALLDGPGAAPPDASPFDIPASRFPTSVAAGGSLLVTLPAIGADGSGVVTAIGLSAADFTTARVTTRVDGAAVAPLNQVFGAVGPLENPTLLSAPIRLGPAQVFSLLVENTDAMAQDIAARVLGWTTS